MEWTADVAAGDWIRERLDNPWRGSMHGVVPRGFEAYARIFHPSTRDRPVGVAWPPEPYDEHPREWRRFQEAHPEIDDERSSWAQAATAFGTVFHPLAQWHRLVRQDGRHPGVSPTDAEGWRYSEPEEGQLDPELVAAASEVLAAHTTTPDDGFVAVWDGWGGLTGGLGYGPSRVLFALAGSDDQPSDAAAAQHEDFLARSAQDQLNNAFRKPTWQPGVLSDDISKGPRLELPARAHVLFRGGVRELADPAWPDRAPWRDGAQADAGFFPAVESPSLVWPADRAWVLVSEVDFDSTIVGGSNAAIRALCADPRLEALPIPADADLTWDADEVNR
jgi:hypothetical protein